MFDFFCINEACVNCGKENATTLTWLPGGQNWPGEYQKIFSKIKLTKNDQ